MKEQMIELHIPSELKHVTLAAVSISAIAKYTGVDEMIIYQIETCAVEAINNAIIHAYQRNSQFKVEIKCHIINRQFYLYISDHGKTMTTAIPDKAAGKEQESGRGWFIMQQWMDKVEYLSCEGKNTVILLKNI
jgi:serine/threonine-protein kinase RsbW